MPPDRIELRQDRIYSWMPASGIEDMLSGWRREVCSSIVRRKSRATDPPTDRPQCFFGVEGIFVIHSPEI